MTRHRRTLHAALAWAGALPFLVLLALSLARVDALPAAGAVDAITASYALVIVSFMAGTHWGLAVAHLRERPNRLLLASNAITLAAWGAWLLLEPLAALAVAAGAFALLVVVDYRLRERRLIDADYLALRRNVSLLVIALLALYIVTA